MNNEEMKKVAVKAAAFAVVSIGIMLHRSATKHIMITDAAGTYIDRGSSDSYYNILIDRNVSESESGKLVIPLPKTVSSDDIVLEDRYTDHEIRLYIDSREEGFYLDTAVRTDLDIFESAVCIAENDSGSVCLDFRLDGLYANTGSLTENSTIEISFSKPGEMYDKIVVVDAAGDDEAEAAKTLEVALSLREMLGKDEDNSIKIYYSRLSDKLPDIEDRCALVRDSEAKLVVEIAADEFKEHENDCVTTYYNGNFFLRNFNNAMFADILERSCAYSTGAEAAGIFEDEDSDRILLTASVPAARVELDSDLIDTESSKKAAEGIYQAITAAFGEME